MIDIKKCPDEFNTKMHETMTVSAETGRLHRIWTALLITKPGDPDFEETCRGYNLEPSEVKIEHFRRKLSREKLRQQGFE